MVNENRTRQIRTALALVIGAALIDRCFLHLLDITPAALIACVLIAVTLGVRPAARRRHQARPAYGGYGRPFASAICSPCT